MRIIYRCIKMRAPFVSAIFNREACERINFVICGFINQIRHTAVEPLLSLKGACRSTICGFAIKHYNEADAACDKALGPQTRFRERVAYARFFPVPSLPLAGMPLTSICVFSDV